MSEIKVTSGTVKAQAQALSAQNVKLNNLIDELVAKENALSGMWEGDARQAYQADFSKDIPKLRAFHAGIERYISALNTIAAEYEKAEAQNRAVAGS